MQGNPTNYDFVWKLLDKYFEGPNAKYKLTQHHLQSYSDFIRYKIPTILQDFNGWKQSEVFNGAHSSATSEVSELNVHARAHIFVGMSAADVLASCNDHTTNEIALPTRMQLRHQVLEYSKLDGKPVRLITPNEARLRNLNYQQECTCEVTIVSTSTKDLHTAGVSSKQFVRACLAHWSGIYTELLAVFDSATDGVSIEELAHVIRPAYPDIGKLCKKHNPSSVPRINDKADDWVRKGVSKMGTMREGIDYVCQRLASELCPHVTTYEDVVLTKLPLMLHSSFCVLHNQPKRFLRDVGECPYEKGGYFVIRGKEKVIISQESYQRNIIQTKSQVVTAPTQHIPVSTYIQQKGEPKTIAEDQEEIFEAVINCSDDPRPPVTVQMQYKRMNYYRGGGGEGEGEGDGNLFAVQKQQMDEMRKNLPFQGLYVTIKNRKLENIITDVPLFLLFRAMGVTGTTTLTEQISDRDILECILGEDLSGVETRTVALSDLRSQCGVGRLKKGEHCWFTPNGEGDCAWLSFAKPLSIKAKASLKVATKTGPLVCAPTTDYTNQKHIKVRVDRATNKYVAFDMPQATVQVTVQGNSVAAWMCGCKYAKRYHATALEVTPRSVTLSYACYTKTMETCDPIFFELLQPSIGEGSFGVTNELARDIVQRMIHMDALQTQDDILSENANSSPQDKLDAMFRTMFTHLRVYSPTDAPAKLLRKKQLYLGYMTKRLLYAYLGLDERYTSRDSYRLRRVQLSGEMLGDVFRYEYFQLQNKYKEYIRNGMRQQGVGANFDMLGLANVVRTNIFDAAYMTDRLQKSFMGKWGSQVANDSDQKAYCQELIRLSYYGSLSYLRRVHKELPTTSKPGQKKGTSKAVGPRLLHASQYGMICPLETPDGGNIGKIKHLSTFAFVCPQIQPSDYDALLAVVNRFALPSHELDAFYKIRQYHKVIIDGDWAFNCPSFAAPTDLPIHQKQVVPPNVFVEILRLFRRNGLLSPLISVAWNIARQEIVISTQEGRVMRPLLIVEHNMLLFADDYHNNKQNGWTWEELLVGRDANGTKYTQRAATKRGMYNDLTLRYTLEEKVPNCRTGTLRSALETLRLRTGVMEYIDTTEIDTRMLNMHIKTLLDKKAFYKRLSAEEQSNLAYIDPALRNESTFRIVEDTPQLERLRFRMTAVVPQTGRKRSATKTATGDAAAADAAHAQRDHQPTQIYHYTHCELHPSLMLGVMGMLIPFPEHSQAPRNQYSCHQSKQALGLYVSSFRKRMDHANHILHYPERALTGSRYMRYINNERLNYGTNAIVAIMCYGGFNIEDSILINKQSVKRGLFQSSYYFTEEVTEKDAQNEKVHVGRNTELVRQPQHFDYAKVDSNPKKHGVIPTSFLNKEVKENDVLIEAYEEKLDPMGEGRSYTDYKHVAQKDGYVDQIYLSDDVKGRRVAKVTLRTIRIPVVGDKIAARTGQKGTIGALIEEDDMPFIGEVARGDANSAFLKGLKPDLILNPHAIPSRMTIGQLLESLSGVLGTRLGCMPDSTPLCSNDTLGAASNPTATLVEIMKVLGMHPHGNQVMYNGSTGEQLDGQVFIGPTYYQRLKQMPTDKYYHRRTGRADMVTRQPIGGRAQGGALKLGEMERDSLLAHGISLFTKEAFSEKSDGFHYQIGSESGDVHPPRVSGKVDDTAYTPLKRSLNFLSNDENGGFREYLANDATDVRDVKSHADVVQNEVVQTNLETSNVHVPFAMRLLSQECEAMGLGMHLIPENHYPTCVRITVAE